jgi:DNA gyrase subunit A
MMFFSTRGKVYRLKVHELPVGSRHARGTAIVNLLPLEAGETIASVINTRSFPEDEYLLFAASSGMTKKTAMSAYRNSRRDGLIAIKLRDDDELIAVRRVRPGDWVVMVSSGGKAIVWDEKEARPMGRDTSGVQGMRTPAGEKVIGMEVAPQKSDASLFVVTVGGYGKRTALSEYPLQHRGGQGVFTIKMTEAKGKLAAMKVVGEGHELMLVSEEGVMIRVRATDISQQGRPTQGVKVMNVSGADRVTAVARVAAAKKQSAGTQSIDIGEDASSEELLDEGAALDEEALDGDASGEESLSEDDAAGEEVLDEGDEAREFGEGDAAARTEE